jgi:hypothetical protein
MVSSYIHGPVPFDLQRKREIFHKRDGAMHANAHEARFEPFNHVSEINSKHTKYQSASFKKWADHSLDEFIRNPSNIRDENANH